MPPAIPNTVTNVVDDVYDWALVNANAKLLQMQALDRLVSWVFGRNTNWIYCGILAGPTAGTYGWAGAYVTSSNTISSAPFISTSFQSALLYGVGSTRQTVPHEIGHNLGFPHDIWSVTGRGQCREGGGTMFYPLFQPIPPPGGSVKPTLGTMTNGPNPMVYGLDTYTLATAPAINPVADPNNCFDLMGYCRSNSALERWSSSYTYAAFRTNINNLFAAPAAVPAPGPAHRWFFIRGLLDTGSDACVFSPFSAISSTATNPPVGPLPGNYLAMLYDNQGNFLEQIPFGPQTFIIEESDAEVGMFSVAVTNTAVQQVRIMDAVSNTVIASIIASVDLPAVNSVTLSATNGGAFTGTGPLVVRWSVSDANPNAQLTYTIYYSADGGVSWETLDTDWPEQTYQIDSQYLRASSDALIAVSASDGFNNPDPTLSGGFTVPNHPPVVGILSPADQTIFIGDEQIFFYGFENDPQNGPLAGASVQWVSSLDGVLGTGPELNFEATDLSEGTHVITVTATDKEGLPNSASVQIYVLRQPLPTLAIEQQGNQMLLSWPSSYTNYVLEASLSLAPTNWVAVTNVPAAADAEQTVTNTISAQTQFFRLRLTQ